MKLIGENEVKLQLKDSTAPLARKAQRAKAAALASTTPRRAPRPRILALKSTSFLMNKRKLLTTSWMRPNCLRRSTRRWNRRRKADSLTALPVRRVIRAMTTS